MMPNVKDHSELPDFLDAKTLARICVDLSNKYAEATASSNQVRLGALHTYYWKSLRSKKDLPQATKLLNEVEL